MDRTELREALASLCHEQWAGWMNYLFSKGYIDRVRSDESLGNDSPIETVWVMPEEFLNRWGRQMRTSYEFLSESEQDSDRKEADKFLALLANKQDDRTTNQLSTDALKAECERQKAVIAELVKVLKQIRYFAVNNRGAMSPQGALAWCDKGLASVEESADKAKGE